MTILFNLTHTYLTHTYLTHTPKQKAANHLIKKTSHVQWKTIDTTQQPYNQKQLEQQQQLTAPQHVSQGVHRVFVTHFPFSSSRGYFCWNFFFQCVGLI